MLDYLIFKQINELFVNGDAAKCKRLLMELQSRFIALKEQIYLVQIRNHALEEALFLSKNLSLEHGFYWLRINGIRQGPFCPRCYEIDGSLAHLDKEAGLFICPYCQENFPIAPPAQNQQNKARILYFAR